MLEGQSTQPVTRYAKSGDVHIAYQVYGDGPINVVQVPGFVSNIETYWDDPDLVRAQLRLASYARVATFDKRGTGMSDRVADLPGLDQRMDDLRAVMDAAGMEHASLFGISEGGPLAMLFAATYPDRCRWFFMRALHGQGPRRSQPFLNISTGLGALAAVRTYSRPRARTIRRSNAGGGGLSGWVRALRRRRLSCT
jgi:pimeloyl-ACP methyl ester carboxylesterase